MSKLTLSRLRLFLILVAVSTAAGVVDAYLSEPIGTLSHEESIFRNAIGFLFGSAMVWGFEVLFVQSRYGIAIRRMHFLSALGLKSALILLIVLFNSAALQVLFDGKVNLEFFKGPYFARVLFVVFVLTIILQTVTQVIRIIGGRNLINFVLGRYHSPVEDARIFLMLDMVGSTSIAQQLGDVDFQSMVTRFFFDITEPILEHGGDIYRYMGDGAIVTWPLEDPASNLRPVECVFAIQRLVDKLRPAYVRRFGVEPKFRAGLHGGPVVISQVGDQKQEISYFGNAINTAARVEEQCKALGTNLLISDDLLNRVGLGLAYQAEHIGTVQLRGLDHETALYTVTRAG